MKSWTYVLWAVCIALTTTALDARELSQPEKRTAFAPVSLVELLGNPDKFSTKLLTVRGYLSISENGSHLYLCSEHAKHRLKENGIAVEYDQRKLLLEPADKLKSIKDADGQYVLIFGKFDSKSRRLSEVSRLMLLY